MAPAGNFECLHAAIQGGADSVYFGVEKLNMRSHSANNFKMTDLAEIVRICSQYNVKTYLTLNIALFGEDLEDMRRTLDAAKAAGIYTVAVNTGPLPDHALTDEGADALFPSMQAFCDAWETFSATLFK